MLQGFLQNYKSTDEKRGGVQRLNKSRNTATATTSWGWNEAAVLLWNTLKRLLCRPRPKECGLVIYTAPMLREDEKSYTRMSIKYQSL